MLEIIKNPIYDTFMNLCTESKQSIKFCAPFVKENIIKDVLKVKQQSTAVNLITNININNFYNGASDTAALNNILDYSEYIFYRSNLHAKFYIFDDKKTIITSGNLTFNGLRKNFEYGVITDDSNLLDTVNSDYNNICNEENIGKINKIQLAKIDELLTNLPKEKNVLPDIKKFLFEDNDNIISLQGGAIANQLKGWNQVSFKIINEFESDDFELKNFVPYYGTFKNLYPDNNHIEEKIRQQLQELRDLGLIEFTARGKYKRLWISGEK